MRAAVRAVSIWLLGIALVQSAPADEQPVLDNIPIDEFDLIRRYNDDVKGSKGVLPREVRWPDGSKIRVAFPSGGDERIYQLIERAAQEWIVEGATRGGITIRLRVELLFRDPAGKRFTWTARDTVRASEVRIAFQKDRGYHSAMGTLNLRKPAGEYTMNLEGFDKLLLRESWDQLEKRWNDSYERYVVLHEFGHVFGFAHEQFHSKCQDRNPAGDPNNPRAFIWDEEMKGGRPYTRDPGRNPNYKVVDAPKARADGTSCSVAFSGRDADGRSPGIYLSYNGWPNCWTRNQINFNLDKDFFYRDLCNAVHPLETELPDRQSVMLYSIPEYLFAAGKDAACYTSTHARGLSDRDVSVIRLVYATAPKPAAENAPTCR